MLILQDLWQLIGAVFLNWVALISGVVSIALLIFQYKHDGRLPSKERFFLILWIHPTGHFLGLAWVARRPSHQEERT
jgi:hypothetical protein